MEITLRGIDSLIPYARNARTHSEEQIARIAASIEEFGMAGAIVVRDGVIAKGHGTRAVVRVLGSAGSKENPRTASRAIQASARARLRSQCLRHVSAFFHVHVSSPV